MKWDLVLFDLDGTLLDTIQDLANAANHAFAAYGLPVKTLAEFKMMVGNGVRKLMYNALPENMREDPEILNDFVKQFGDYYKNHLLDNTLPYEGIQELVDKVIDSGVTVAVASNKFQAGAEFLIKRFFPGISIIYGDRPGLKLKPEPDMINLLLDELEASGQKVDRSHCVLVGDAISDIQAAAGAGIQGIGVSWGLRPVSILLESGVPRERIAFSISELGNMLLGD